MISMAFFLKSLKDLKREFIHFIHKSPKTSKCLITPLAWRWTPLSEQQAVPFKL